MLPSSESFVVCFKVETYSEAAEPYRVASFLARCCRQWVDKRELHGQENLSCIFINIFSNMDDDDVILLSLVYIVDLFLCEWTEEGIRCWNLRFYSGLLEDFICFHDFICTCLFMKHLLLKHFKRNWRKI